MLSQSLPCVLVRCCWLEISGSGMTSPFQTSSLLFEARPLKLSQFVSSTYIAVFLLWNCFVRIKASLCSSWEKTQLCTLLVYTHAHTHTLHVTSKDGINHARMRIIRLMLDSHICQVSIKMNTFRFSGKNGDKLSNVSSQYTESLYQCDLLWCWLEIQERGTAWKEYLNERWVGMIFSLWTQRYWREESSEMTF